MNNILQQIVATKQKEVQALRSSFIMESARTERKSISLVEQLTVPGSTGIIAEFKRKSPSKGWFKPAEQSVLPIIKAYEQYGAAGASILTDEAYFGGSAADMLKARSISSLPLLRKDFIIDDIQLHQAKAMGADVVLLIAAILTPKQTRTLSATATSLGLEVLLEIHEEKELDHICDSINLVGVNNRDLTTFATNIDTSFSLIDQLPADKIAISESGISDVTSIKALRAAGYDGFLIGENFMKQADTVSAFKHFTDQLKAIV